MRQVCQPVSLRRTGPNPDHRHTQQEVTLKEPFKPSVNHKFRITAESVGTDGQDRAKTQQEKDQRQ